MDNFYLQSLPPEPSSKNQRKAELVKTVVEILATQGVDELTLERVGKKAGMARSHVVYYFKNRDSLIRAAVDCAALSAQTIIQRQVDAGKTWQEKIDLYIQGCFLWIEQYPQHASVYTLLYYLATIQPAYRALHSSIREAGVLRIQGILGGSKLKPRECERMALAIQSLVTGHLLDVTSTHNKKQLRDRLKDTQRMVSELLDHAL